MWMPPLESLQGEIDLIAQKKDTPETVRKIFPLLPFNQHLYLSDQPQSDEKAGASEWENELTADEHFIFRWAAEQGVSFPHFFDFIRWIYYYQLKPQQLAEALSSHRHHPFLTACASGHDRVIGRLNQDYHHLTEEGFELIHFEAIQASVDQGTFSDTCANGHSFTVQRFLSFYQQASEKYPEKINLFEAALNRILDTDVFSNICENVPGIPEDTSMFSVFKELLRACKSYEKNKEFFKKMLTIALKKDGAFSRLCGDDYDDNVINFFLYYCQKLFPELFEKAAEMSFNAFFNACKRGEHKQAQLFLNYYRAHTVTLVGMLANSAITEKDISSLLEWDKTWKTALGSFVDNGTLAEVMATGSEEIVELLLPYYFNDELREKTVQSFIENNTFSQICDNGYTNRAQLLLSYYEKHRDLLQQLLISTLIEEGVFYRAYHEQDDDMVNLLLNAYEKWDKRPVEAEEKAPLVLLHQKALGIILQDQHDGVNHTRFLEACKKNQHEIAQIMLLAAHKKDMPSFTKFIKKSFKNGLFLEACTNKKRKLVEVLLVYFKKNSPQLLEKTLNTSLQKGGPFLEICTNGDPQIVQLLMDYYREFPELFEQALNTALQKNGSFLKICTNGDPQIVWLWLNYYREFPKLLKQALNTALQENGAFLMACTNGDLQIVWLWLDYYREFPELFEQALNTALQENRPFLMACTNGDLQIVRLWLDYYREFPELLKQALNISLQENGPFLMACTNSDPERIRLFMDYYREFPELLEQALNISLQENGPFLMAFEEEDDDIFNLMLNAYEQWDHRPFEAEEKEARVLLYQKALTLLIKDPKRFLTACQKGKHEIVEPLLSAYKALPTSTLLEETLDQFLVNGHFSDVCKQARTVEHHHKVIQLLLPAYKAFPELFENALRIFLLENNGFSDACKTKDFSEDMIGEWLDICQKFPDLLYKVLKASLEEEGFSHACKQAKQNTVELLLKTYNSFAELKKKSWDIFMEQGGFSQAFGKGDDSKVDPLLNDLNFLKKDALEKVLLSLLRDGGFSEACFNGYTERVRRVLPLYKSFPNLLQQTLTSTLVSAESHEQSLTVIDPETGQIQSTTVMDDSVFSKTYHEQDEDMFKLLLDCYLEQLPHLSQDSRTKWLNALKRILVQANQSFGRSMSGNPCRQLLKQTIQQLVKENAGSYIMFMGPSFPRLRSRPDKADNVVSASQTRIKSP